MKKKQPRCERKFVIRNKQGLHARPAALFVQSANRFDCEVEVFKGKQKVDGKSIMGIMMLAAGMDSIIRVRTKGIDASSAMEELAKLIEGNFGEGEAS